MKIAVLGAGNWGTTISILLDSKGHNVGIWEFNKSLAAEMIRKRENVTYLKGYPIPESVLISSEVEEIVNGAEIVVFVVPSSFMRDTARAVVNCDSLSRDAVLVNLSKGLEFETLRTMTEVIADEIPDHQTVVLSGPCIAAEVARKMPTTIVSGSDDKDTAHMIQDAFMTPAFRIYTSDDPAGVQLGGALKNIVAIAAGIGDGLDFGTNAKSAIITRGIVEMTRFGVLLGAKPETFNGLSGIGDLITTCISEHSRNRRVGEELAAGRTLEEILKKMVMIAEGVPTTKAVYEYSVKNNVDMPITEQVYSVLFKGMPPERSVSELMSREKKHEHGSY
ncbi:NAD(P)H-dependent glycerol-3-phosphate dehydrogenase [Candidatus Latescibacterota bacterium]